MGQRLVIYIKKGDEVIGNCYNFQQQENSQACL